MVVSKKEQNTLSYGNSAFRNKEYQIAIKTYKQVYEFAGHPVKKQILFNLKMVLKRIMAEKLIPSYKEKKQNKNELTDELEKYLFEKENLEKRNDLSDKHDKEKKYLQTREIESRIIQQGEFKKQFSIACIIAIYQKKEEIELEKIDLISQLNSFGVDIIAVVTVDNYDEKIDAKLLESECCAVISSVRLNRAVFQ